MERPGGHAETGCTSLTSDSGIGRPSWFGCCPAVRDATTRGRRGALSCCTGKLLLGPRIVAAWPHVAVADTHRCSSRWSLALERPAGQCRPSPSRSRRWNGLVARRATRRLAPQYTWLRERPPPAPPCCVSICEAAPAGGREAELHLSPKWTRLVGGETAPVRFQESLGTWA